VSQLPSVADVSPYNVPGDEPIVRIVDLFQIRELQEQGFIVTPYRNPPLQNPGVPLPTNPFSGPGDVNIVPPGFLQVQISRRPRPALAAPLPVINNRPIGDP
jgi:hypothetical protein